jgi:hypothetical protein
MQTVGTVIAMFRIAYIHHDGSLQHGQYYLTARQATVWLAYLKETYPELQHWIEEGVSNNSG